MPLPRPVLPRTRATLVLALLAAPLAASVLPAAPAQAAGARANWQMNEAAGATVMRDSSGHGHNGTIGRKVQTHVVVGGRTGYAFAHTSNLPGDPADPARVVTVPSSPDLNPGDGDYSVKVVARFGPNANYRNLVQKGQSGAPGGFYKLEVDRGGVTCLFRGSAGSAAVGTGQINNGAWHTITCSRTAGAVTMTVDGRVTASKQVAIGTLANNAPVAIGGKSDCAQPTVECDYFVGGIDQVVIS